MEALDLAVGARPVGLRAQVLDPAPLEQLAQRAVLDLGERVVGHQPPGCDPVALEPGQRALDERRHRRRPLVCVQLDVGEPRVVVDDRVGEVLADSRLGRHPPARALRTITGDRVAGALEARIARDVDFQQIAWARPLAAVGGLLRRPLGARCRGGGAPSRPSSAPARWRRRGAALPSRCGAGTRRCALGARPRAASGCAAAAFCDAPFAIASVSAKRPAGPSLALA